jgi:hypothetical protein
MLKCIGGIPMDLTSEFEAYLEESGADFTGRGYVLRQVADWLSEPGTPSACWIYGGPGCGKTALASHLWRISQGKAAQPPGMVALVPGFLQACFFCHPRKPLWKDPKVFAQTLSAQLQAIPEFRRVLEAQAPPERHYHVRQEVGAVHDQGQVTGVYIRFEGQAQEVFNLGVLAPLSALLRDGFARPITILLDGLDDSLTYTGRPSITDLLTNLEGLPSQLRWIFVSGRDARLAPVMRRALPIHMSDPKFAEENDRDLCAYLEKRLQHDDKLHSQLEALDPTERDALPKRIARASEGIIDYAKTHLDAVAAGLRDLSSLEVLPQGMQSLCLDLLDRVTYADRLEWRHRYAPILGVLSAARQNLTVSQLCRMTGLEERPVREGLADLQPFLSGRSRPKEGGDFWLSFRPLVKLLAEPEVDVEGGRLDNRYYLPTQEWHQRIAQAYAGPGFDWTSLDWQEVDSYGVCHLVDHAAAAGELSGIHYVYKPEYLERKRQVLGSEIPLMDEALEVVMPQAGAEEVLGLVYNVLYELRPNSYRAVRTLSAAAQKTRQLPELHRQLKESSQPLAKMMLFLSGEQPVRVQKWRQLKTSLEKDSSRKVQERRRDLALMYLAWGLSGQEQLLDDLLEIYCENIRKENAAHTFLHTLAWYAAEGLRELGAGRAVPKVVRILETKLAAPEALARSTSLYIVSRWGMRSPAVAEAIQAGLHSKRSSRQAGVSADASRLLRGLLPDDQVTSGLIAILSRGAAEGRLVVYCPKDPWNYPRRRALRALGDLAPANRSLLEGLQVARSQFAAAPHDDYYAAGTAQLLEVAIQRVGESLAGQRQMAGSGLASV